MPKPRGANIQAIRTRSGEKRTAFAARCGISYQHLYGIEQNYAVNQPSIEVLHRIANALGVDISEVMEDEEKDGDEDKPEREPNPTSHPEPNRPVPPPPPRRRNGARGDAERGAA